MAEVDRGGGWGGGGGAEEQLGFRVGVCLTRYFADERSYCYVRLDTRYEAVAGLERYLRRLFRLQGAFCLMSADHLLPSEEKIRVVRPGDIITVVPLQNDWRKDRYEEQEVNAEEDVVAPARVIDISSTEKSTKKKKKKKSKPDAVEQIPLKKEKPSGFEQPKTPEKQKGSDMDISGSDTLDSEVKDEIDGDDNLNDTENESDMEEPQKVTDMQATLQLLKQKALSLLTEASVTQKPVAGVSGGRINKRKRIRKKGNKRQSLSISTPDLTDTGAKTPTTYKTTSKPTSHIRFDEVQPAIMQNALNNTEIIKPRIIHAIETLSLSRRESVSVTPVSDNESLKSLYRSPSSGVIPKSSTQKEKELTVESVKKRLNEFPIMDAVYPVPKDLILFKMLKMGKDYTPSFSDYILANVLEVHKEVGDVKISVLDGRNECLPPAGKFDLEPSDVDTGDGPMIIDVAWNQVVDPRLIFA